MSELSKVNINGQITIPKKIRNLLDIKIKEKVLITIDNNELIITPIKSYIMDLGGSLKTDVTVKDYNEIEEKLFEDYSKDFVSRKMK